MADDDWKYAVSDFEDDPADASDGHATDVLGEASGPDEIVPGSPSLENVVFVLVGVALAVVVILGV